VVDEANGNGAIPNATKRSAHLAKTKLPAAARFASCRAGPVTTRPAAGLAIQGSRRRHILCTWTAVVCPPNDWRDPRGRNRSGIRHRRMDSVLSLLCRRSLLQICYSWGVDQGSTSRPARGHGRTHPGVETNGQSAPVENLLGEELSSALEP